jgi:hypothetical protein
MTEVESSYNATTSYNQNYVGSSALHIRLDTSSLLENIEFFLRGEKIVVDQDAAGKITTKRVSAGTKKANDLGVQSILNYISAIINPHVVQGNFPSDSPGHSTMYEMYIEEVHMDLTTFIVNNCYDWEVRDNDIDVIIDFIMMMTIPFMTRLIDNKERESYETTLKHVDSKTITDGGKDGVRILGSDG